MTVKVTWTPAHGGGVVKGETALEIVRTMWASAFLREPNAQVYMRAVARRAEIMTGCHVRTGSARQFLEDLEAAQIITIDERS